MVDTAKSLLTQCAAEIMSHYVIMIPREMTLQGAARMLARAGVTGAPVVDENGRCIGVLSATDFMHWMKEEHTGKRRSASGEVLCTSWQIPEDVGELTGTVDGCMTKDPVLAHPNVKIGELARMMMDAHVHRVIVVDRNSQRPIGVVSSMDILAAVARAEQARPPAVHMPSSSHEETVH
jgi:predicted transcriptional regulator